MSDSIRVEGLGHGTQPIPTASRVGPLIMSGSVSGIDRTTGELPDGVAEQVSNAFANMAAIVEVAGGTTADIVKIDVHVTSRDVRAQLNPVWVEVFPDEDHRPARHVTVSSTLPAGMHLQCELTAWLAGK